VVTRVCGKQWEAQQLKEIRQASARARFRARDLLLFFRGKCTPTTFVWDNNKPNRGKKIRLETMRALMREGDPAVRIECTGDKNELGDVRFLNWESQSLSLLSVPETNELTRTSWGMYASQSLSLLSVPATRASWEMYASESLSFSVHGPCDR
jgi:hypothetical protein